MSLQHPRCMKCRVEVPEFSVEPLPRGSLRVQVWCHGETEGIELTAEELRDDVIPGAFCEALKPRAIASGRLTRRPRV